MFDVILVIVLTVWAAIVVVCSVLAIRDFRAADRIYRRLEADDRRSDEARRTSPYYNPHRLEGQAWRDWSDGKLT